MSTAREASRDGQVHEPGWNCRNSLFQFNYGHDNEGGFMLVCNEGKLKTPVNPGISGTVVVFARGETDAFTRDQLPQALISVAEEGLRPDDLTVTAGGIDLRDSLGMLTRVETT